MQVMGIGAVSIELGSGRFVRKLDIIHDTYQVNLRSPWYLVVQLMSLVSSRSHIPSTTCYLPRAMYSRPKIRTTTSSISPHNAATIIYRPPNPGHSSTALQVNMNRTLCALHRCRAHSVLTSALASAHNTRRRHRHRRRLCADRTDQYLNI